MFADPDPAVFLIADPDPERIRSSFKKNVLQPLIWFFEVLLTLQIIIISSFFWFFSNFYFLPNPDPGGKIIADPCGFGFTALPFAYLAEEGVVGG